MTGDYLEDDDACILEGAPLSRYEGVGHFPPREAPLRFQEEIERFLDAESLPAPKLKRQVRVHVSHERTA